MIVECTGCGRKNDRAEGVVRRMVERGQMRCNFCGGMLKYPEGFSVSQVAPEVPEQNVDPTAQNRRPASLPGAAQRPASLPGAQRPAPLPAAQRPEAGRQEDLGDDRFRPPEMRAPPPPAQAVRRAPSVVQKPPSPLPKKTWALAAGLVVLGGGAAAGIFLWPSKPKDISTHSVAVATEEVAPILSDDHLFGGHTVSWWQTRMRELKGDPVNLELWKRRAELNMLTVRDTPEGVVLEPSKELYSMVAARLDERKASGR